MLFSVAAVRLYIPTSDTPVSPNPHQFLLLSVFLIVAILMSVMYIIFKYQQCVLQSSLTLWSQSSTLLCILGRRMSYVLKKKKKEVIFDNNFHLVGHVKHGIIRITKHRVLFI